MVDTIGVARKCRRLHTYLFVPSLDDAIPRPPLFAFASSQLWGADALNESFLNVRRRGEVPATRNCVLRSMSGSSVMASHEIRPCCPLLNFSWRVGARGSPW